MDCIFCKVVKGELPSKTHFEDDRVLVFEDIYPQAPVHLLVVPKMHILDIIEAESDLISHLLTVARKLVKEKNIVKFRFVTNGRGSQLVEHLHIHIMGGIEKERKL